MEAEMYLQCPTSRIWGLERSDVSDDLMPLAETRGHDHLFGMPLKCPQQFSHRRVEMVETSLTKLSACAKMYGEQDLDTSYNSHSRHMLEADDIRRKQNTFDMRNHAKFSF